MNKYLSALKLLLLISLMLQSLGSHAAGEPRATEKIVVGYFDLPPHTPTAADTSKGPAMEFFDQVASKMGIEVEYVRYPLDQLLFMLETNRIDAALMLAKNEERVKKFIYPGTPIFTTIPVVAVLNNSDINSIEQIANSDSLMVGVWRGGFHSPLLEKNKNKTIALTGNDIAHRGLEILVRKRIDAFFSPDSYSVVYEAKQYKLTDKIKILSIPNEGIDLYTVFAPKTTHQRKQGYEQALASVKQQNSYESLLKQRTPDLQ